MARAYFASGSNAVGSEVPECEKPRLVPTGSIVGILAALRLAASVAFSFSLTFALTLRLDGAFTLGFRGSLAPALRFACVLTLCFAAVTFRHGTGRINDDDPIPGVGGSLRRCSRRGPAGVGVTRFNRGVHRDHGLSFFLVGNNYRGRPKRTWKGKRQHARIALQVLESDNSFVLNGRCSQHRDCRWNKNIARVDCNFVIGHRFPSVHRSDWNWRAVNRKLPEIQMFLLTMSALR